MPILRVVRGAFGARSLTLFVEADAPQAVELLSSAQVLAGMTPNERLRLPVYGSFLAATFASEGELLERAAELGVSPIAYGGLSSPLASSQVAFGLDEAGQVVIALPGARRAVLRLSLATTNNA